MSELLPQNIRQPVLRYARQIHAGELSPYKGAAAIWAFLADEMDETEEYPEALRLFVGLASEWQDQPDHRDAYEEDIRDEARLLLERHGEIAAE